MLLTCFQTGAVRMGRGRVLLLAGLLLVLAACDTPAPPAPTPILPRPSASPTPQPTGQAMPSPSNVFPTATAEAAEPSPDRTEPPSPEPEVPTPVPGIWGGVAILAYHHLNVPAGGVYNCSLADFAAQVGWLQANGYQSVLPADVLAAQAGRSHLPAHAVLFTFDDNNQEQYTLAAPILERAGYRGAFFVDTVTIGKRHFMTAAELQDLVARGHVVGSHTWSHRNLAILTPEEVDQQLAQANADLTKVLGAPPQFLSYPYGVYSAEVAAQVAAHGYLAAFRLHDPHDPPVAPAFMLPRQIVNGRWKLPAFIRNIAIMTTPPRATPTPTRLPLLPAGGRMFP